MFHRLLLALAFAGFACSSVAAPWTKAADPTWHAPQLTASGVTGTLGGSPRDLDPDPAFGFGTGQMTYDLGHVNALQEEGMRVYAMAGNAGWYVLARHERQGGGSDAVVLQVNPHGEAVDEFLVPTPLGYIADAVMDPATGKFYFVGDGHNPVLPGDDSDFAVTCMDITIPPDGGPCVGFGTGGTAWVGFNLGGDNHERAMRVVVRPNIGLILAGLAQDQDDKWHVAVASLYRASGALYTPFGTNGRFVSVAPKLENWLMDMVLSNDPDAQTRIYIGGGWSVSDDYGDADGYVLALKAIDGVLDTGFNGNGIRSVALNLGTCDPDCNKDVVSAMTVQADGKLSLAGAAYDDTIIAQPMLGRLKVDGSFDTGFHATGLFSVGTSWPGHAGIWPMAIAERPDTRALVVAMRYGVSTAPNSPVRQLLAQWSSNGNTLRASRSFEFTAHAPEYPRALASGLLVDADSAMMVGSRRWDSSDWSNEDWDITLVRTLVDMDFLFSDGFE